MNVKTRFRVAGWFCLLILGLIGSANAMQNDEAKNEEQPDKPVLKGRIVDDKGNPVTDASLSLYGRRSMSGKTDEDGNYEIMPRRRANDPLPKPGTYQLRIESKGWVGETNFRKLRRFQITPGKTITQDITLKRAASVQIRVVDENEEVIPKATVYYKSVKQQYGAKSIQTDPTGLAVIRGLDPESGQHLFACKPDGYAFARLTIKVTEPKLYDIKTLMLEKGQTIKGTSVCSDGLPPAGWKVQVLPSWWDLGIYSNSFYSEIADDGSFEVTDVVDGDYRLSISVPGANGSSTAYPVGVMNLLKTKPVKLKMNYPSPASMSSLSGTITYSGGEPKRTLWISADSTGKGRYHGSARLDRGAKTFEMKQLPKGVYSLRIAGDTIETVKLENVKVPGDDLKITIKMREPLKLTGRVLLAEGTPAEKFKISVVKLRTLGGGPNYVHSAEWVEVSNKDGAFEAEVKTPGIYQVTALADGFAATTSRKYDTTKDKEPLEVVLAKGVPLAGVVVDGDGNPVAGATVKVASLVFRGHRGLARDFVSNEGALKTDAKGQFRFPNLAIGSEQLQVEMEGYAPLVTERMQLDESLEQPLRIELLKGGTLQGLVYDGKGKRKPAQVVYFIAGQNGGDYERGQLAKVASDDRGFFKVTNLPTDKLTYIVAGDEWRGAGVVRRAVLAKNGKRTTVMFGGPKPTTGVIKIDGKPLADTFVLLTEEDANFGSTKALSRTDKHGRFQIFGAPPGVWTLYYDLGRKLGSDWSKLAEVELGPEPEDLGEINSVTGALNIQLVGGDTSDWIVAVHKHHPLGPVFGDRVAERQLVDSEGRLNLKGIANGELDVVASKGSVRLQSKVTVTNEDSSREVKIKLPKGTASVKGQVDTAIARPGRMIYLWNADGSMTYKARVADDGTFEADELPEGRWLARISFGRNIPPVVTFDLKSSETTTINITEAAKKDRMKTVGMLGIRAFTKDGALTPCHVTLNPMDDVRKNRQRGGTTFVGAPAEYSLEIKLKGFKTIKQTVTMKAGNSKGAPAEGWQHDFLLEEAKD